MFMCLGAGFRTDPELIQPHMFYSGNNMKKNQTQKNKAKKLKLKLKHKKEHKPTSKDFLSTGSTLLNLAITGNPNRGYLMGHYYLLTGTSKSGKTWLALSALAEAANNPNFDNHRIIYDDVEHGALMDKGHFFGKKLTRRIEPPKKGSSYYMEDFYFNVQDAIDDDKPFIYILDSMDSLTSNQEVNKFHKRKQAKERNKEITGTMTDGKAKLNSQNIRVLLTPLFNKKSILITIHQTRQRMGIGAMYQPDTRSGGNAPGFYVGIEIWSKVVGQVAKTVRGKQRQIGTFCELRTRKNRLQGNDSKVVVPILRKSGLDDIGSCVDFLCDEKQWTKNKSGIIDAVDLKIKGNREKIIRFIEKNDLERDIQEYVSDVWDEIEEACSLKRKPRYE